MLSKSLLQSNVLTLVKLVLGGAAERRALIEAFIVRDQVSGTLVSVQKWNIVVVQFLL